MGKAEVGTPKWLGNKMKSKGLQKLRWYCQMCQKQCRDENGFKCHTSSESHQRQLLLFADNSRKYLDEFSHEFEKDFLNLLRRQFGTKRVHANVVYQEYIRDRNHTHMNATKWTSLTGLCKYLSRTGKVVADETEKGWFITYIDRDPETIARQEALAKKTKMDKDDQERVTHFIEKQVQKGKQEGEEEEAVYTELKRENPEEKIQIQLGSKIKKEEVQLVPSSSFADKKDVKPGKSSDADDSTFKMPYSKDIKKEKTTEKRKLSALDEIMREQEASKEKSGRKDYWLTENIVVKVVTKSLGDKYYKKKGFIKQVIDKYGAMVTMIDTGHTLKLDQSHLETVIPAEGRTVMVVNGAYRGYRAVLKSLDAKNFCVTIIIDSGPVKGRVVEGVQYEDICKIHTE
ncbi:DNA/RNA-binding protein KIN17-like [Daphnia carinata]|uniref:DNA/RNA-binding protein KIN17-like n=1 Tax=Daphnia carinata TaxID=120202 RepID=UPI002579617E|nr:DNA/RNA-binding protein KIN17-like [Daphnia carinata]